MARRSTTRPEALAPAIIRFVDKVPGALPNEPTEASADSFAASGR